MLYIHNAVLHLLQAAKDILYLHLHISQKDCSVCNERRKFIGSSQGGLSSRKFQHCLQPFLICSPDKQSNQLLQIKQRNNQIEIKQTNAADAFTNVFSRSVSVSQITKAPNIARPTYLNPKLNKQLNGRLIFILNEIVSVIFAYNDNGRATVVIR